MPTTADAAMNTTGCSFFVGFTTLVRSHITRARMMAGMEMRSVNTPVSLKRLTLSRDISTTEIPAAAMSAVEAGRRP